jgi:hypothetical protein
MLMRVQQRGEEVHIELIGVTGRHERILQAVSACRQGAIGPTSSEAPWREISVRAQSDSIRICMRPRAGRRFEPAAVYQSLRHALFAAPPAATVA